MHADLGFVELILQGIGGPELFGFQKLVEWVMPLEGGRKARFCLIPGYLVSGSFAINE